MSVPVGEAPTSFIQRIRQEFSFIKGNYAVLITSWILIDFAVEIPVAYYALYVLGLGATETIVGTIGLFQFLALASMQFPGGYLADKFGRKWLISSMTFGVTLSYIFYAIAPSWHFILIGAVLMSFFNSTYQPALMAMVADSLPPEKRGMGFGIVTLIASASTTPGPVVAALLFSNFGLIQGMRIGYGIIVGLFLIAAILRAFKLKETMVTVERPGLSEILKSYPVALKESLAVWKKVPSSMLYLFLSLLITQFGFATVMLYFPLFAINELLIDAAIWPLIMAAVPITIIILSIPVGKAVDKATRKIPLLASYLVFGASMWLFMNGNITVLFVSLALVGVGQVMLNAAFGALQADLTPRAERGKVMGFANFVGFIVMALGNLAGGVLYEHFSPHLPFLVAAASVLPSFVLTLLLVHEPEKKEE
ncbi:MAG: MFS transporter [Candidatus Bathyarchaeota archaeon]|jgi:MFS family permease|nr:MAG: MFS transporter [Candidatus Bathyarchaeota archaeon]